MTDFNPEWVRALCFHIRRADGIVGPISRAEVEQGLSSGRFHEEMPSSVDMGSTWHPLRQHLGLPDPTPQPLPSSLEQSGSTDATPIGPVEAVPSTPEPPPSWLTRQRDRLRAWWVGLIQGLVPVAIPLAGGAVYLGFGHAEQRTRHLQSMADYAAREQDAIPPGDIERAVDPALWKNSTRPYVAIEGVLEAQRKARERIPPDTVLRLKATDGPPSVANLQLQRAQGKEWLRGEQSELLIAASHQARASVSPAERVEDFKPDAATRYLKRQAVEKSVQAIWESVRKTHQESIDIQRKKMARDAVALTRVVEALRDPAARKLYPGLDVLCENPPALADLPAALARIVTAGQNQPMNP
jgi:hypothetical protein